MLPRSLLGIPSDDSSESPESSEDDGFLILHPSDDEFSADYHEEIKIPFEPKEDAALEDPRGKLKERPKAIPTLTWCLGQKSCRDGFTVSSYRPARSVVGDARALKSLLNELRVESATLRETFRKICVQTFSLIKRSGSVKGTQAAFLLKVLSDTALSCLRVITHLLSSGRILDTSQVVVQQAFTLLKTLAHRRSGCGRAELQSAARNVAWFLAFEVERTHSRCAEETVYQLLTWKRLMSPFPRAWEVVQWALRQRLMENVFAVSELDDIEPVFKPWYLVLEKELVLDAAKLWLSTFSFLQLRKKPALLSRNLESLRVALHLSSTLEVSQLTLAPSRF